jgi:SAM-dependent methyltransferase
MNEAANVVSKYWAVDRSQDRLSWLQHPIAQEMANRRVSGDPAISPVQWFKNKYVPRPLGLALSLGCGHGAIERAGLTIGLAKRFHANDLSSGAIEQARAAATAAGVSDKIEYSVLDLDGCTLPPATYDAIFAISSAHHVFQLENLFRECRKALKYDGLMFLNEYIGPSRFQSAPEVVDAINQLRDVLPEKYRRSLAANDGSLVGPFALSAVDHFEKTDPSEAVRSGELVSTLAMYFDIVEIRPYGGALQHMLFDGIMGNFNENDEGDAALLRVIATFEELMESAGVIDSDFAAIVARPKRAESRGRSAMRQFWGGRLWRAARQCRQIGRSLSPR